MHFICCFHIADDSVWQAFNITLEVYNFPLKEQSEEEKTQLEIVKSQRRVEIAELAVCYCQVFSMVNVHDFVKKWFIATQRGATWCHWCGVVCWGRVD